MRQRGKAGHRQGERAPIIVRGDPLICPSSPRPAKLVLVLDAASVIMLRCSEGGAACVELLIQTPNRARRCEVAAKAVRRTQAAIREHGIDGVACLIQGPSAPATRSPRPGSSVRKA
jgi:hypothetical protein